MFGPLTRWYFAASVSLSAVACLSSIASPSSQAPAAVSPKDAEFFEIRIRPVLFDNCFHCHGDQKQAGGLRLDSSAELRKGAASGPVIVAGKPEESRLIRAVEQVGPLKMPPTGKLRPEQIADLTEWVRRGAPWPETKAVGKPPAVSAPFTIKPDQRRFWSFQPVRRPGVPVIRNSKSTVRNPIDSFILAGLQKKGLTLSPPADRRTLIRRATYDLTGLPPTPAEVEAFLKDRSPHAWEKVIDRLLASPRYGERWGRHWLDLVRYCDSLDSRSLGSEGDISEAWRYRDWVIDALNADMPYTDFIVQQIAGDIAPAAVPRLPTMGEKDSHTALIGLAEPSNRWADYRKPNASGIIATTMLSIGNWGNGDADKDKILTDIADDQVDVVSRTFMGLTMGCARCHNHKFDPLSQQDYYGLAGIFFSTHILAKLTPKGAGENIMKVPLFKPELDEARKKYAADLAALENSVNAATAEARRTVAAGMLPDTEKYMNAAWEFRLSAAKQAGARPDEFAAMRGLKLRAFRQWLDFQGPSDFPLMSMPVTDILGSKGVFAFKGPADTPSVVANPNKEARQILTFTLPPRSVSIHPGPASGVAVLWASPIAGAVSVAGRVADADPAAGDGIAWGLGLRSSAGFRALATGGFENGGMQDLPAPIPVKVVPGDRIELHVLPKASHTCDTTTVDLRITEIAGRTWDLTKDVVDNLTAGGNPHPDSFGNAGVWRFVDMAGKPGGAIDPVAAAAFAKWRDLLANPREEDRGDAGAAARSFAASYKLADSASPFWPDEQDAESALSPDARQRAAVLRAELDALRASPPPPLEYANGALEGGVPESPHAGIHDVPVHLRGRYDRLAEMVPRRFPTVLAGDKQPPITSGSGRLELARWLASESHPLTARVIVNRVWQHHFGEGIVRTPSNFGFLGERPTHPELLDWLATCFAGKDEGGRMRDEGKTPPATSSFILPPSSFNMGWSIKRLHKLIMLSATYQQSSKPSPLALRVDPDNRLFARMNRRRLEAEEVRDSLLAASGKLDTTMGGPAVRDMKTPRRTVYVMTVRSDRTGFGPLFDMADSTNLVDKRTISTVAPQALFLLNDPFAMEHARELARRLLAESLPDDGARIQRAYNLLFGRAAQPEEVRIGQSFLAKARRAPKMDETAWMEYSQILLSANEFMYVD